MTIQIKHSFVCLKGDGTDATQVQPSNWNAAHSLTLATGNLLGRLTAGAGAVEEIPISAYMASLLGTADATTLAGVLGLFETGDIKFTFKGTAAGGWLLMLGGASAAANSIGNAASGAVLRANADTLALFTLIYNNVGDADAPVSGGRSGNPVTDFNANKVIFMPQMVGRSPMGAGAATLAPNAGFGTGALARLLGRGYGEENHTLIISELASHVHANSLTDPTHAHAYSNYDGGSVNAGGGFGGQKVVNGSATTASATGITITNASQGSDAPHNTIHPTLALNVMVKL